MDSGDRSRSLLLAILPAVVGPLLLSLPFLGGEVLLFRDILNFVLPQQGFAAAARASLHFPGWSPLLHGGAPFFGEPGTGFLYPANLVFHLFSPERAATAFVLLHLPLAGAGTFFAARVLGLRELAASLCGCAFVTSGYLLSMHGGHYYAASAAWLPLLFGVLVRLGKPHGPGPLVAAAAVITLMVFNGELQSLLMGGMLALPLLLLEGPRVRALTSIAVPIGCGALLSAVQLVPMVMFASDSVRGEGLSLRDASRWSLHPLRWIELVAPHPFGIPYPENEFWGTTLLHGEGLTLPWAISLYLSAPVVMLALGAAWRGSRQVRALLGATLVALLLAGGAFTPVFGLWFRVVPFVNRFRYPEKYAVAATLALVLAAGFGMELFEKEWRRFAIIGGLSAIFLLGAGWLFAPSLDAVAAGLKAAAASTTAPAALARFHSAFAHAALLGAMLAALAFLARARPALASLLLIAVVLVDGVSTNLPLLSYGDAGFMSAPPAILPALQARGGRFVRDRGCRFPDPAWEGTLLERKRRWEWETGGENFLTLFGVADALGYGAALPKQKVELVHSLGGPVSDRALQVIGATSRVKCRGAPSVAVIDAPLARVAVLGSERRTAAEIMKRLGDPAFDLNGTALLEEDTAAVGEGPRSAIIEEETPDRIQVRVEGAGGILRLSEGFWKGWSVTLDGAETRLLRSDLQWRAAQVPAGAHTVVFRFRTPGLIPGAVLSALGMVALTLFALRKRTTPEARHEASPGAAGDGQ